jgi:hypothetical protein
MKALRPNALALILLSVALVASAFQSVGRYIISYKLAKASILVTVFGIVPVGSIPYRDIETMQEVKFTDTLKPNLLTLRFGNRIFGNIVLIKKSRGILKTILITPDHPANFIEEVGKRRNSING